MNICNQLNLLVSTAFKVVSSVIIWLLFINQLNAQESLCASVRIEIVQELAFERQGFDANMRINNALDDISVEDVNIDVLLMDENNEPVLASSDPDNTEAKFFIRVESMSGIDDINGSGVIAPESTADIHWLIVPAQGAGGSSPNGTLYYAGATLSYTMGGEEIKIDVSPDYIYVKPMPLLTLDYFLPRDVYADDAFTGIIEPAIPFDLGVRITNNGFGEAGNVSIDSAQPKIIDNELGLLINFVITGSSLNDQPVEPTLLIPFGDLGANEVVSGRWQMETTLSGEFVEFTAEYSHVDELGGELTSLLESVNTHELVHNVLVDLQGRDGIRDFLAKDGDTLRVYESSGLDTLVTDQSSQSTLNWSGQAADVVDYTLQTPTTDGFLYAKFADPHSGTKQVGRFLRSDGKTMPANNVWLSQSRKADNKWEYFIHVFDVNSNGRYLLAMENKVAEPVAPVLQFISDKQVLPGSQVSFLVEASDLNGTLPAVTVNPLPAGASLVIDENGAPGISTYIFDWTPTLAQVAEYELDFVASDGVLQTSQNMKIRVCASNDSDCDGMDDDWEMENFGTLGRDGTGDFDGDGFSDFSEYINGSNPLVQDPPSVPEILQPLAGTVVKTIQPLFEVENSIHGDNEVTYAYEVYSDEGFTQLIAQAEVFEQVESTLWDSVPELLDNSSYFWRVRTCNEDLCSEWAIADFTVNLSNEAPGEFAISAPQNGTAVSSLQPSLAVTNSIDPDGDLVQYQFSIFDDEQGENVVEESALIDEDEVGITGWTATQALNEGQTYYWDVIASDPEGLTRSLTSLGSFVVNTINSPPTSPTISSPMIDAVVTEYEVELIVGNSTDEENSDLVYHFEIDTLDTFSGDNLLQSNPIAEGVEFTGWIVQERVENQQYFWRAKADDGVIQSDWVYGQFLVSQLDDPPSVPTVKNPGDGAWVESLRPELSVNPSVDPENEFVSYRFEIYSDETLTQKTSSIDSATDTWIVDTDLQDNTWYYWRVGAQDSAGNQSDWTTLHAVFINDNGVNDPPSLQVLQPTGDIFIESGEVRIAWEDEDPDSNASISIFYEKDNVGSGGIAIASGISEDDEQNELAWSVSTLEVGVYFVYLTIEDGDSSSTVYANSTLFVGPAGEGNIVLTTVAEPGDSSICFAFDVALSIAPKLEVTLNFELDTDAGSIQPSSMLFKPDNWSQSQRLNVSGFSNCSYPAGPVATLSTASVMSDDPAYDGAIVDDVVLEYKPDNIAPVANAGDDLSVEVGTPVTLNGTASRDEDNLPEPLSYTWRFSNVPADSTRTDIDLIFADTASAGFIADVAGSYELTLTVSDGDLVSSDTVLVTIVEPVGQLLCDVDGNGVVEQSDILAIFARRNQPAEDENDPMDADGDGTITLFDVRICQARL
jgi:hypothetical protein